MPQLKISIPSILCAVFAVCLQIQLTFFSGEDYAGLRLNLADLLLPATGIFILFSLCAGKTAWPQWKKPFDLVWLLGLTAIITFSLFNSYHLNGELSNWAFINKFVGWFILMAYCGAGAWLATNYTGAVLANFAKPFVFFFLITGALSCSGIIISGYGIIPEPIMALIIPDHFQLKGLMGNRNAFAFLLVVATVFTTLFSFQHTNIVPRWFLFLFWFFFPFLILLNESRASWLAILLLLAYFGFSNTKTFVKFIALPILLGAIAFFLVTDETQKDLISTPLENTSGLYNYVSENSTKEKEDLYIGDSVRFTIINASLERWRQNPVLGAGLGGGMAYQQVKYGETIDVIDNSMLWILTDMGLVGLAAFLLCFAAMLTALWPYFREQKQDSSAERQTFLICSFLMLLVFGLFSLVHEILYTRFFWFILGLALAQPLSQHSADQMKPSVPKTSAA